jgi:uncharacterized membrane protein
MMDEREMESYLAVLRTHLGPVTLTEREEIVREITAHIRDASEQPGESVESVLERLGPAEALAAEYRDGLLIRRAGHSFSPLLLMRAALRLATQGFFGGVVFFCALFGYLFGGGMLIVALVKCVAPLHAGAWVADGRLVEAGAFIHELPPQAHEVLGFWLIPVALTLGSLTLLATTAVIRFSLRLSRHWQARLCA